MNNAKKFLKQNLTYLIIGGVSLAVAIIVVVSVALSKKPISEKGSASNENSSNFLNNDTTYDSDTTEDIITGGQDESVTTGNETTTEPETDKPVVYNYAIRVNVKTNCVTIYKKDENGEFTIPYKAMACSAGKAGNSTPLGTWNILSYYSWCRMVDWTYSQYAYRIHGSIMFHSLPSALNLTLNGNGTPSPTYSKGRVEVDEFNKLGSNASLGCIRLTVADAKWICDNCPSGTQTTIVSEDTDPLPKPEVIKIPKNIPAECGGYVTTLMPENHKVKPINWVYKKIYVAWDPTDPDPKNPWHKYSPSITCDNTITVEEGSSTKKILEQLTAKDTCGNIINEKVHISGNYNLNKIGKYTIELSLTDALGKKASKTITLNVVKKGSIETTTAIPDETQSSQPSETTSETASESNTEESGTTETDTSEELASSTSDNTTTVEDETVTEADTTL